MSSRRRLAASAQMKKGLGLLAAPSSELCCYLVKDWPWLAERLVLNRDLSGSSGGPDPQNRRYQVGDAWLPLPKCSVRPLGIVKGRAADVQAACTCVRAV